jgi:hypothetical protein
VQSASDLTRWDFDQDGPLFDADGLRLFDAGNLATDPASPEENRAMICAATSAILKWKKSFGSVCAVSAAREKTILMTHGAGASRSSQPRCTAE